MFSTKLINEQEYSKIDMVITKSISRLARSTVTMIETARELKELNVDVCFEKENIHSLSGDGELVKLRFIYGYRIIKGKIEIDKYE